MGIPGLSPGQLPEGSPSKASHLEPFQAGDAGNQRAAPPLMLGLWKKVMPSWGGGHNAWTVSLLKLGKAELEKQAETGLETGLGAGPPAHEDTGKCRRM